MMLDIRRTFGAFRAGDPIARAAAVCLAVTSGMSASAPSAFAQETVSTFASDCVTPRSSFALGESVCARVTGSPLTNAAPRRFNWVDPGGFVLASADVTADPQTDVFTLPTVSTSLVGDETIDNRGTWRVNDSEISEASLQASAFFTVHDPLNAVADLSVTNVIPLADSEATGSSITSNFFVTNLGPDDAASVELTVPVPAQTSLLAVNQDSGPSFACATTNGVTTCAIAALPAGGQASFSLAYQITTSIPGTVIFSDASVSSATTERAENDNAATANATVIGGGGGGTGCTLTCPADVTQANDPDQGGAVVNYSPPLPSGTCGAVDCDPAVGSFFAIGPTIVSCSTAAGDTCSFTVTVQDTRAIRITLNGDNPATVECHTAFVDPGATALNLTGGSVPTTASGTVNANAPGAYTITYTATEGTNTATATRTVNVVDTTPPELTADGPDPLLVECASTFVDPGATAQDTCTGSLPVATSGTVDAGTRGAYTVSYSATDGTNDATLDRTVMVVDTTPPIITLLGANPMTVACHVAFSDPGATASDACVGTAVAPILITGAVDVDVPGAYALVYSTNDGAQTGTALRTVNVVDVTAPTITCPADVVATLPPHSSSSSMAVSYPAPTATDDCTTVSVTGSPASGSQFPVGTTTVNATATDAVGHASTCTFRVTVKYAFTGFFPPVGNPPVVNKVNAGQSVPVKFSLSGNKGLAIFAPGSPSSAVVGCDFGAPAIDVEGTENPGGSSLGYDPSSDQYNYVWKTQSAWAGTCRQLVVTLLDGSVHVANMRFK